LKKKDPDKSGSFKVAEEEGFEPPIRSSRMPVFKTGAINRSATPPKRIFYSLRCANVKVVFIISKQILQKKRILMI